VQAGGAATTDEWAAKARRAEELGYSTLFVPDHFGLQLAPMLALQAAADATTTLRVGTLVLDNDYRHPVMTAKEAATLDVLSGGRLELGLGAGWLRSDYDESGMPYDPPSVRVDRFEEGVAIVKGLLSDGAFSFEGEHYRISNLDGRPKPVQRPLPILIGGGGRRMLGIAGREGDILGVNPNLSAGAVTPEVAKDATAEANDRKLAWLRAAAGDRFDHIELNVLVFIAQVTPDRRSVAEGLASGFGLTVEEALDVPLALVGRQDEIAESLVARRERWGFSYYVVQDAAMESFAPIVSSMTGA
jgi:probable F420-dependent oxidoreductase